MILDKAVLKTSICVHSNLIGYEKNHIVLIVCDNCLRRFHFVPEKNTTIAIEKISAGIEHDDAFEEYTVSLMGPDREHPFEYYCAADGIVNTWATVVVEFRSPSVPEVTVADFPQNDNCNSILVKCDGMGDGK